MSRAPPPGGGNKFDASPPRKKVNTGKNTLESGFPSLSFSPVNSKDNPKFVIMKSTNPEQPLNTLNIFLFSKALNGMISESQRKMTKFTRDGNLLILTTTKRQAELLIKAKKLSNICDISCTYHDKLNTVKGVVYCPELKNLTEEEITTGLQDQHVTEVQKIRKLVDGKVENSPLHILSFDLYALPNEIKIGFQNVKVDYYIPKPMQCKSCHRIGHTKKRCRGVPMCNTCSMPIHNEESPCESIKCINCNYQHRSTNKQCPTFLKKQEIIKHSTVNRTSIADSTKHVNTTYPSDHFTKNIPIEHLENNKETNNTQKEKEISTTETTTNQKYNLNQNKITEKLNQNNNQQITLDKPTTSSLIKSYSSHQQNSNVNINNLQTELQTVLFKTNNNNDIHMDI